MSMPKKYFTKEEAKQAKNLRDQQRRDRMALGVATALVQEVRHQIFFAPDSEGKAQSNESIARTLLENYRIIKK